MKALTVARKEIADHMNDRTFLLIFGLMMLLTVAMAFQGAQTYEDQMENYQEAQNSDGMGQGSGSFGFTPEEPTIIDAFMQLTSGFNFSLIGGLLALFLSFAAVSGERERNTLQLLTTYPIHRDSIITGKFIAGLFTLTVTSAASFLVGTAVIIGMTGASVTGSAAARILLLLVATAVYMSCIYGLGTLFSTVFRKSSTALIGGVVVLVLSTLVIPQLSFIASDLLVPDSDTITIGEGGGTNENFQRRMEIRNNIVRFTPTGSYGHVTSYMLGQDPYDIGVSTGGSDTSSGPTVMESLRSSMGSVLFLLGQTILFFGASYVLFTRKEIE